MNAAAGRAGFGWAAACIALAVALAAWSWHGAQTPAAPPRPNATVALRQMGGAAVAAPAQAPGTFAAADSPVATVSSEATVPDLRQVYDADVGSSDPRLRRVAARAYAACVPLFVASAGETPSPEPMIQALPRAARAEREQAYRALFARCGRFVAERPDSLAVMGERLSRDVQSQEPALRAREALLAGRLDEVGPLAAQALNGGDPADIAALSGLVERLARADAENPADANALARARAVDAALPAVACQLGLDCGSGTLKALQLCAVEGLCEGDVAARMQARYGQAAVDPAAVEAQKARLIALIRSGRPLALEDLLP